MKTETSPIRPIDRVDRDGSIGTILLFWPSSGSRNVESRLVVVRRNGVFVCVPAGANAFERDNTMDEWGLGRDVGTRARAFVALI